MSEKEPRREDIPGITANLPDISNWKTVARILKIRPFYKGPDSKPFSCLHATLIVMDPPLIVKRVGHPALRFYRVNDYSLAPECRD
jgi:hypothetical protein